MGKPEITKYVSFEWIGLTTCELEILKLDPTQRIIYSKTSQSKSD